MVEAPADAPEGFSMGDYCDDIPPELLYDTPPEVVAEPVVQEEKKEEKSVKGEGEEQEDENDDDKGDDKSDKADDDETTDKVKAKVEEKQNKEIEKLKKLYETKFISRFLKIIEVYTSIAQINSDLLGVCIKVSTPEELSTLLELLMYSCPRHGMIILKIVDNLIRSGVPSEIFEESIQRVLSQENSPHQHILSLQTTVTFKTKFLQFLYNYSLKTNQSLWSDNKFESHGQFNAGHQIQATLRFCLNKSKQKTWIDQITAAVDTFINSPETLSSDERAILINLIDGAECLGLTQGSYAQRVDGSLLTVIGFVEKWHKLKTSNNKPGDPIEFNPKQRLWSKLSNKDQWVLALHYDSKHNEGADLYVIEPEEIKV